MKEEQMSDRERRGRWLLKEMIEEGGFTEQQALYLIRLLDRYLPLV